MTERHHLLPPPRFFASQLLCGSPLEENCHRRCQRQPAKVMTKMPVAHLRYLTFKDVIWLVTGLFNEKNLPLSFPMAYGARRGCGSCFAGCPIADIEQFENGDALSIPKSVAEVAGGSDNRSSDRGTNIFPTVRSPIVLKAEVQVVRSRTDASIEGQKKNIPNLKRTSQIAHILRNG